MSPKLKDFLPPLDEARQMPEEDLAVHLLRYLLAEYPRRAFHRSNVLSGKNANVQEYADGNTPEASRLLTEAWMWLEHERFLVPDVRQEGGDGWFILSRKAEALAPQVDLDAYKKGKLLPRETLDPVLTNTVRPLFLRGDYDTAIFRAFKEVETRVRKAGRLPPEIIGVDLMRKAFHPDTGPLTDKNLIPAERQAASDLFAGGIGVFKNPSSHREVSVNAEIAAQAISLANLLVKMVEARVLEQDTP